jgi:hypothetical protein
VSEARQQPEEQPPGTLQIGDHDLMSRMAFMANVTLCGQSKAGSTGCNRAAGHDEVAPRQPRAKETRQHVATDGNYVITAVWK